MGACASKFSVLKNAAADAPPPGDVPSKDEDVIQQKEVSVNDESKPQSLAHLLNEKTVENKAEDGENVVALNREEGKAIEICGADEPKQELEEEKPDQLEMDANQELVKSTDAEKKHEEDKTPEIIQLATDVENPSETTCKTPEMEKTEEQKAEEKPTIIQTSDKHVVEPLAGEESVEKHLIPDKAIGEQDK